MTTNLNFGQALEAVKQGKLISREGWNGKGMHIYLNLGSVDNTADHKLYVEVGDQAYLNGIKYDLFLTGDIGTVTRNPNINMKTADGSIITGWLASQTDMLAEDWCILN